MTNNHNAKQTVMVCDDDEDIVTVIDTGLENKGYAVHSFHDPIEALRHVEDGCKDCEILISDVRMPNMNGFQLVRRIREINPDIKVIMMTAFEVNKPEFETVFPSMNVDGVLRKPFLPSRLAEMVKEIYEKESKKSNTSY